MKSSISRRTFFGSAALVSGGGAFAQAAQNAAPAPPAASAVEYRSGTAQFALPRWRGFNLLDLFQALPREGRYPASLSEDECRWMRDWGFNFIRIPMDYWFWVDSDWRQTRQMRIEHLQRVDESALAKIDRIVDLGRKYGLHVNLNFHRAPGYCINNPEREPFVLWSDSRAEDAFVNYWDLFARRYKGVSPLELSFNLVNEAPRPREGYMRTEDYRRVMTLATERIRSISPNRIVLIDGYGAGNDVVEDMIPTGVGQSVHCYWPGRISHYRAAWVDRNLDFPMPEWPMKNDDGTVSDRTGLAARLAKWAELARQGIGVHCGECGCYNKTPYGIFLAWFTDVLDILQEHGIGFALWNLSGTFGVLDSGREDIQYEDWFGHKLDRRLLTVMQTH